MYVVFSGNDQKEHLKELTKQTKDDFPEQQRKTTCVAVYKHILKSNADVFPNGAALFYDRAAILFSAQMQLKLDGEEKQLNAPASLASDMGTEASCIRVVIKKVTDNYQVNSNEIRKAVSVRDVDKDKAIFEVLNLAMSQKGYLETSQFVTYGSNVHYLFDHQSLGFRDDELPVLADGKYAGIGLTKSVKVLEGNDKKSPTAFVVTDVTKGAFHNDDQNLLEKISQMSIFLDPRSGNSCFNARTAVQPFNVKAILQQIKGLYVSTTYGKKKRTFQIGGTGEPPNKLMLQTPDGKRCTIEQYLLKQYNLKLKYPWMVTVSDRHNPNSFYPTELLTVAPSQRVKLQQQTPDQVAAMIKASATLPQSRMKQTKIVKEALDICSRSARLAEAGISVDDEFVSVPARLLPAPVILYGQSQKINPTNNCKWDGDRSKFLEPAQLTNWAVCTTLTQYDGQRLDVNAFIGRLESRCRMRGMRVDPAAEIFSLSKQNYEGLKEWFATQKQEGRRFLVFITSDGIKIHGDIKLLEVEYQILSQEIKGSRLLKQQNQTMDNIIAKINIKLGGVNYNVQMAPSPGSSSGTWFGAKDTLFVGFEISNPMSSGRSEIPSVLGWAANCAKNSQQYLGDYIYVKARQPDMMGEKLCQLMADILTRFRTATTVSPRHIVIYFSGISEGQFSLVTHTYMEAVNKGILSLKGSGASQPTVTALAVSKDHNERLYKKTITGSRAAEQNIAPGTVVDSVIVSPVINEFYLNAHSTFQGTAKVPKYSLLADNSNVSLDALERMTHGLCYLHGIITATVSEPVPLVVADRCAKRGHDVFIANLERGQAAALSVEEANEKLVHRGALRDVRYCA